MPTNPLKLRGYEKFWNALVAGNIIQVPIVVTLAGLYYFTKEPSYLPSTEVVIGCVGIFWGALGAAIGAYLATNSPTDDADGQPVVTTALDVPVPPQPVVNPESTQGNLFT